MGVTSAFTAFVVAVAVVLLGFSTVETSDDVSKLQNQVHALNVQAKSLRARVTCLETPHQASSIGPVSLSGGKLRPPHPKATLTGCGGR